MIWGLFGVPKSIRYVGQELEIVVSVLFACWSRYDLNNIDDSGDAVGCQELEIGCHGVKVMLKGRKSA